MKNQDPKPELSPSAALYGFMAWLTCFEEPVTFSANHDAALAAELVSEFCDVNGLADPVYQDFVMPTSRRLH